MDNDFNVGGADANDTDIINISDIINAGDDDYVSDKIYAGDAVNSGDSADEGDVVDAGDAAASATSDAPAAATVPESSAADPAAASAADPVTPDASRSPDQDANVFSARDVSTIPAADVHTSRIEKKTRKQLRAEKKALKKSMKRTRRRRKKGGWIFLFLVIAAVAAFFIYRSINGGAGAVQQVRFSEINRDDLKDMISVKGNVQSVTKRNVYSTLGMTVQSVGVSVGDAVKEGQVMCRLDKEDLELNIEQTNAEINASVKSGDKQIESSEKTYSDAAENLRSGSNPQIMSAEASVRNAQLSLESAQTNYNNIYNDYMNGSGANRKSAESAVNTARNDLETRQRDHDTNAVLYGAGAITREQFNQSESALNSAQTRYDDALTSLDNVKVSEQRSLEQASNSLKSAQTALSNAQNSLNSSKRSAEQELERYESNVESSRISANVEARQIALKKLEKQLADSEIKSPVDGVVTAVYAKEGGSGSGLLFIVEDPEHLSISIRIKEYDAGKLAPGMPVVIKSDAISGAEYAGTLTKIDPAAVKNTMGETDTISDIEFGAEVSVDTPETLLRIGMNARVDIIIEQRDNVFFVPFDAIKTDADGNSFVYSIEDVVFINGAPVNGAPTGGPLPDDSPVASDSTADSTAAGSLSGAQPNAPTRSGGGGILSAVRGYVARLTGRADKNAEPQYGAVAREIPVEIGLETDFYIEISGPGLENGLRLINEASDTELYDGMPVDYNSASSGAARRTRMPAGIRIG